MLRQINKVAPYALVIIFGYLTHSMTETKGPRAAKGKESPVLSQELLEPKLVTPQPHASPADRDPFEVAWHSYLKHSRGRARKPASAPASRSASKAASRPTKPLRPVRAKPPSFPGSLTGVIIGPDVQLAVIGHSLYKPGMLIGGTDPKKCWELESIHQGYVIIRFAQTRRTLLLHSKNGNRVVPAPEEISE